MSFTRPWIALVVAAAVIAGCGSVGAAGQRASPRPSVSQLGSLPDLISTPKLRFFPRLYSFPAPGRRLFRSSISSQACFVGAGRSCSIHQSRCLVVSRCPSRGRALPIVSSTLVARFRAEPRSLAPRR